MAKIFSTQFHKGSLIDSVSKTLGTATLGASKGFRKTEKGLAMEFDGSATKIVYSNDVTMVDGDSVFFDIKCADFSNYPTFFGIVSTGYNCIRFESNGVLRVFEASNSIIFTKVFKENIRYFIEIKFNGSLIDLYVNGLYVESKTWSSSYTLKFNTISTGYSSRWFKGYIGQVLIESGVNTTRRNELYKEFLQASPTEKPVRGFEYPKPTDLSSEVDSKVGDDLISTLDFTSGWGTDSVNTVATSPTSFTTSGSGWIRANYTTAGKKYRCHIKGTTTSGAGVNIYDKYSGTLYASLPTGSFDKVFEFTATVNGWFLIRNVSSSSTTTITNLTIQELTGLVAAYSFSPETVSNGTLLDVSGNGNNGTISGALLTKDGMNIPYREEITVSSYTMPSLTYTVCWRGSVNSITDSYCRIFAFGSYIMFTASMTTLYIRTGADTVITLKTLLTTASFKKDFNFVYSRNGNIHNLYVNGNLVDTKEVVSNSIPSFTGFGNESANSGDIILKDAKVYNYAFTPQQAKAYHNSFVKPELIEDFSNHPVGETNPKGWVKGSGSYKIDEIALEQGERVTNGGFDSDTSWGKTRATIANGVATINSPDGSNAFISQSNILTIGKRYKLNYEIVAVRNGSLANDSGAGQLDSTVGTHTTEFTAIQTYFNIKRYSGVTDIDIDNVSIVEIPPLPTITTGTKYLECTSNGTIIIPADLDSFTDNGYIEIDRWNGVSWTTHKSTVDALKALSWFDYSNKKITLTGTTEDRFTNLNIYNGVKL